MEEIINQLTNFLFSQNALVVYAVLFVCAIAENLCPPIPGDTITALGAFLVGTNTLNFGFVYAATTAGSVVGFMMLFAIGYIAGKKFFDVKNFRFFPKEKIAAAEIWFHKYGYLAVLLNRFAPGVRSVISLAAGISKLNAGITTVACAISASLWNLIWLFAGYSVGNNWEIVKEKLDLIFMKYNIAAFSIIGAAALMFILYKLREKHKAKQI